MSATETSGQRALTAATGAPSEQPAAEPSDAQPIETTDEPTEERPSERTTDEPIETTLDSGPDESTAIEQPAESTDSPGWTWRRFAGLAAPALVFLVVRQIGLAVLAWMGALNGRPARDVLTAWDAQWYLGIAGGGYDNVPAGLVDAHGMRGPNTALAFFPGYPAAIRAVATLPGVSLVAAAFTVSMIAGIAGSYGLVRIGERIRGGSRWIGLILVALFAAAPMAIVESMAYSETLFCALAAWSLAALLKRDWVAAGVCCALAGLVRPTAAALILAVCLAALVAIVNRRDGWRPWVGGLLAPLGLAGYLGWVAIRTGSLTGYFQLQQAGWDSHFDGGAGTWKFSVEVLNNSRDPMLLLSLGTIIAFLIMLALGWLRRVEWPLMIYGLAVLVLDLGSYGLMNSKARLLLPAFTLLIPVAVGLAGRKRSTAIAVLVGVTLFSAWFGGYSLTVWPYAI